MRFLSRVHHDEHHVYKRPVIAVSFLTCRMPRTKAQPHAIGWPPLVYTVNSSGQAGAQTVLSPMVLGQLLLQEQDKQPHE